MGLPCTDVAMGSERREGFLTLKTCPLEPQWAGGRKFVARDSLSDLLKLWLFAAFGEGTCPCVLSPLHPTWFAPPSCSLSPLAPLPPLPCTLLFSSRLPAVSPVPMSSCHLDPKTKAKNQTGGGFRQFLEFSGSSPLYNCSVSSIVANFCMKRPCKV